LCVAERFVPREGAMTIFAVAGEGGQLNAMAVLVLKISLAGIYLGSILWWFMEIYRLSK